LRANLVDTFLHLVLQAHQAGVEEWAQTREGGQVGEGGKARKAVEEFGQLGQQGTQLTLDSRLIHSSSRDFRAVCGFESRCVTQGKSPDHVWCVRANCRPTRGQSQPQPRHFSAGTISACMFLCIIVSAASPSSGSMCATASAATTTRKCRT